MITAQGTVPGSELYSAKAQKSLTGQVAGESGVIDKKPPSSDDPDKEKSTVSISNAARKAVEHDPANASALGYEQFMPTYDGFSAAAIAVGVSDPGAEPFSSGKTFDQVAIDARASLDKNYQKLDDIGKTYRAESANATDRNSLVGELDRRALYAVVSNEGGLFTKDEQALAQSKMSQQQGLAMGLYSGPSSEQDKFFDPFLGDTAQKFKAGIQFFDQVSNEEKANSIDFAIQRASLQQGYEGMTRDRGETPEDFSTDHPLVNLILLALDSANGNLENQSPVGIVSDAEDLRNQPWFANYTDRLDNVMSETRDKYLDKS